ncbi:C4-dicarboxylate ABC transporter substrate-binding protein [Roseovarius spongiae]|uniref:C4-dicarboxylate ABC transporter substrate-binding protein n=1 Tax=Roseovarius spongiae TaxID=2320272 RepID=A0A3A8AXY1_9RHOB|nr:TRAP transporter substrate-binding protein [Roseovarius spongiae]RKF16757.1 C4-dicarboxylate ABC transporter substrate-binding protein [Roseovarius spongiae]
MFVSRYLGGAVIALAMSVAGAQAETWDMATPYPDATFHTVNINEFADDVAEATDGALEIKVHSAGSLFKHPEISKAVRSGQVPIGEFFLSLLANDNPVFAADGLPFLATNYDEAERLWDAQKDVIEGLLDKQGMMVLYAVPWPPQGLYTDKPIETVDDLAGLKFRTNNATLEEFANLAGAAPTQIEVPDIPQAFSTGRVEAMITSPSTGANSKAWDFLSHYTDIQAWIPKNVVVVNKRAFRRLDESTQQAILDAAEAAEERGWEMSREETDAKVAILKENGITVVEPSQELMDGLREIGATMLENWKAKAGAEGEALLEAYQK